MTQWDLEKKKDVNFLIDEIFLFSCPSESFAIQQNEFGSCDRILQRTH